MEEDDFYYLFVLYKDLGFFNKKKSLKNCKRGNLLAKWISERLLRNFWSEGMHLFYSVTFMGVSVYLPFFIFYDVVIFGSFCVIYMLDEATLMCMSTSNHNLGLNIAACKSKMLALFIHMQLTFIGLFQKYL